eukprot:s1016_g3.t1
MLINQFRCFLQSPALAQLVRILLTKDMRAVSMPSSSQNCCFGIAGLCARVVQPRREFNGRSQRCRDVGELRVLQMWPHL